MEKIKLSFLAGLFSFFTIGVLSALTYKTDYGIFLIASFGSTMVILYGYPDSPFAQPKNIFFGHLLTALVGIILSNFFNEKALTTTIPAQLVKKFNIPIVTFIDTPGAYAGLQAEEQGQGEAIAVNLREMFRLRVPVIATVIGEGGSGGALGIGVADRLLMFEHSVYTVASPEACASILWRDAAKAPDAATALRITGVDLLELGVVDEVLEEPSGGNNWAPLEAGQTLRAALERHLAELLALSERELRDSRYRKFRAMGRFVEGNSQNPGKID